MRLITNPVLFPLFTQELPPFLLKLQRWLIKKIEYLMLLLCGFSRNT